MKIKLPITLTKTHKRVTNELVKDIKVLEAANTASDNKVLDLKRELNISKDREKEKIKEIEKLKLELEQRDKKIQDMKWCIQERDKKIENLKQDNFNMYKKLEMASEMQRQVKDKIDTAFIIDFVTKKITPREAVRTIKSEDVKKLSVNIGEDLVEIYTKIGMML